MLFAGQRDEFGFAGHREAETVSCPVGLGLIDAFLAAGNEVPPKVAGAIHRLAAEHHELHRRHGLDDDLAMGREDQQLSRRELASFDCDGALNHVGRALLNEEEQQGHRVFVIESIPHEEAAVVWGKEVLRIRDDNVLVSQEYYDQEGVLVKILRSLEIGVMGGRPLAIVQRMAKADTEDEWTEFRIDSVEFDIEISDNVFTRSNLQNPRE